MVPLFLIVLSACAPSEAEISEKPRLYNQVLPCRGEAVRVELDAEVALVQLEFCTAESCMDATTDALSRDDEFATERTVHCPTYADRAILTWVAP